MNSDNACTNLEPCKLVYSVSHRLRELLVEPRAICTVDRLVAKNAPRPSLHNCLQFTDGEEVHAGLVLLTGVFSK